MQQQSKHQQVDLYVNFSSSFTIDFYRFKMSKEERLANLLNEAASCGMIGANIRDVATESFRHDSEFLHLSMDVAWTKVLILLL